MKRVKKGIVLILLIFPMSLGSCAGDQHEKPSVEKKSTIAANTDLVIGAEDQPFEHQLGRPEAVRVDGEGNIYIADRASMEIKVFDREGNYTKSLGGRGRGPGEFQDIELMEWTPEGHLVVMDRGNMQYKVISTEGEEVDTFPYNLTDQFYPKAVRYVDGKILALFYNSSSQFEVPDFERDIFHVYSPDFQQREWSFLPVKELGFDSMFLLNVFSFYPGSFALSEKKNTFVFSPSTYTGNIHQFQIQENVNGEFEKTLKGVVPRNEPFELYTSAQQYKKAVDAGVPRATMINYAGEATMGRQLSMDAGIYYLNDGRIAQFYAEWGEGNEYLYDSQSHPMDLYVQIFDRKGELQQQSYLLSYEERHNIPYFASVNFMDDEENFYLLDYPEDIPTIRRFSLDLDEVE